jgi:hypothetical protein
MKKIVVLLLGLGAAAQLGAQPYYYQPYYRPNYAVGGLVTGSILGSVIGHASGHHGWEGAAIGAGAGLFLGSIAEHSARQRERACYDTVYSGPALAYSQPAATQPAQQVTVINNNNNHNKPAPSNMSGANALFGR